MTRAAGSGLPPYAYIPGSWPHPSRHPRGHGRAAAPLAALPLDAERWRRCPAYVRGRKLFEHGYYWEAHEAWEIPWSLAAHDTVERDLCQGLILLAAAGLKVRQSKLHTAQRFCERAGRCFESCSRRACGQCLAGLVLPGLITLARDAPDAFRHVDPHPDRPVEVVFPRGLPACP